MSNPSDSATGRSGSVRPMPGDQDMQLIRDRLRLFLVLVFGLVVLMSQPLPFRLAGIPLAAIALWVGIRLLLLLGRLRRGGHRSPGAITLVTGLSLSAVLLLLLVFDAAYYPLVQDLENCQAGAQTQTASDLCQQEAQNRVDSVIDKLRRSTRATP